MKPKISVMITCCNAEKTLSAACESVQWAEEIIIVDSGSTDQTAQIAKTYATKYIVEPWRGYTGQKKFGAEHASNDWVLILDSDEIVNARLAQNIQSLTDDHLAKHDLFWIKRKNFVFLKHVRAWDPDWQSRLIHKDRVIWLEHALHEGRKAKSSEREGKLGGHLLHKPVGPVDFMDYFGGDRMDKRLLPVAREMYQRGKRCHCWDLLLRPALAFLKFYFIKGGLFSGSFGLLMAQKASVSTQLKYAALWYVQKIEEKS
ncbi:MAG: glycosyltransferase family 2 protein [Phycisphaeraceae bacterium]|nr:glycosyltransferase family 2 protein [Phycisphaeraceae bacterium]